MTPWVCRAPHGGREIRETRQKVPSHILKEVNVNSIQQAKMKHIATHDQHSPELQIKIYRSDFQTLQHC